MRAAHALLLASTIWFSGCGPDELLTFKKPTPTIPSERTLTDNQGRQIEARIIGRSLNDLTIVRLTDSKQFTLPIARLSSADQEFARKLPLVASPPSNRPKAPQRETGPIVFKRARLEETEREISKVNAELSGQQAGSIKSRSLTRELNELFNERTSLLIEISSLEK